MTESKGIKLPYDVKVGNITFRAGVDLETFIFAARRWHDAATHPEAQGNKDLGEPALRALVEELANALREVRRLFAQYGHVLFDSEADDIEQTIDAALVSYQARSAAPTSPQPIKGESELESASNGMGLR